MAAQQPLSPPPTTRTSYFPASSTGKVRESVFIKYCGGMSEVFGENQFGVDGGKIFSVGALEPLPKPRESDAQSWRSGLGDLGLKIFHHEE
jgi:hypothetical protein